jgi:hypothetical protein
VATPFDFRTDTFEYGTGIEPAHRDRPAGSADAASPPYAHHCLVMLRAARQFFYAARFDDTAPRVPNDRYRDLVERVLDSDPRSEAPLDHPVVIPGFGDLRSFSAAHEDLLKRSSGGRWGTYFQRGNWRMIFFFGDSHQRRTAESLLGSLERGHPPIVHLVRFPRVTINHALLIYRATSSPTDIAFVAYDPNEPDQPQTLVYDRAAARFHLPRTSYWPGGAVTVYEIYDGPLY